MMAAACPRLLAGASEAGFAQVIDRVRIVREDPSEVDVRDRRAERGIDGRDVLLGEERIARVGEVEPVEREESAERLRLEVNAGDVAAIDERVVEEAAELEDVEPR